MKQISVRRSLLFMLVLLNVVAIKYAYTAGINWIWIWILSVPFVIIWAKNS